MPYHVRITHKDPQRRSRDTLVLDKDEEWINREIVTPRERGAAIFVSGKVIEWDDIDEIHITWTDDDSAALLPGIEAGRRAGRVVSSVSDEWHVAKDGADVTEQFFSGPPGQSESAREVVEEVAEDPSAVMVVHGQDERAVRALVDWLRAVGLRPQEWSQLVHAADSGSPFIGDVLDAALAKVQAVVALFTPDERVAIRDELTGRAARWRVQARPNVLFEAGMAFATHPRRTVLVVLGDQELPSDLAGRHYIRLGGSAGLRDLAGRLERAGCPVDISGTDWLDETRFPDRSGVEPAPRLDGMGQHEARSAAYRELLIAHAGLVDAYSGRAVYDSEILGARRAFAEAESAVMVAGSKAARSAAEALRAAWTPAAGGIYMGSGAEWRDRVEGARNAFLNAIENES